MVGYRTRVIQLYKYYIMLVQMEMYAMVKYHMTCLRWCYILACCLMYEVSRKEVNVPSCLILVEGQVQQHYITIMRRLDVSDYFSRRTCFKHVIGSKPTDLTPLPWLVVVWRALRPFDWTNVNVLSKRGNVNLVPFELIYIHYQMTNNFLVFDENNQSMHFYWLFMILWSPALISKQIELVIWSNNVGIFIHLTDDL